MFCRPENRIETNSLFSTVQFSFHHNYRHVCAFDFVAVAYDLTMRREDVVVVAMTFGIFTIDLVTAPVDVAIV